MTASHEALIRSVTQVAAVPLVPEVTLNLLMPDHPLWTATPDEARAHGLDLPYWAFAWPGGQALARWLLDHPELVRGRSVIDLGSGCAIEGVAARLAGASRVVCIDADPVAAVACSLNARLNGVELEVRVGDALAELPLSGALVLAGDFTFEPSLASRLAEWLARTPGCDVLLGDARRVPLPFSVELLGSVLAPFDGDPRGRSVPWPVDVLRVATR